MLSVILTVLFLISCVVLIAAVLLQPGKADAGALFTSTINSAAFGPRGTLNVLAKITIGAAAAFMLLALIIPLATGTRSVMQGSTPTANPTPVPSPVASPVASPVSSPVASPEASPAASASPAKSEEGKKDDKKQENKDKKGNQ